MKKALTIALGVGALTAVATAPGREPPSAVASGQPHTIVGMGEQQPDLFEDPRLRAAGIRHVRLLVPWDVVKMGGWPLQATDLWLERARRDGMEPLVSFGHSWSEE